MSGLGSFSTEAYKKLQEAYSQSLKTAEDLENKGIKVGNQNLGVETAPLQTLWSDKINLWSYPNGEKKPEVVENPFEEMESLSEEDLEEILKSLELEEKMEEEVLEATEEEQEEDEDSMTIEELKAIISTFFLDEEEDEDEDEDEFDLDSLSSEEFDSLIESLLEEIEDEESEDMSPEENIYFDSLARQILEEMESLGIDVSSLTDQDLYYLVNGSLIQEDPLESKLDVIEEMIKELREEI